MRREITDLHQRPCVQTGVKMTGVGEGGEDDGDDEPRPGGTTGSDSPVVPPGRGSLSGLQDSPGPRPRPAPVQVLVLASGLARTRTWSGTRLGLGPGESWGPELTRTKTLHNGLL